ncbi:hypothetical protein [Acinetobacter sp. MD2(2019)]|uniref:hypothetical protein n=1 Tax=Acinetobacter sp. MD2(2019) TaxID=2605273 RepID=UPI002D1F33ED|nr:hypothetical protein [Acinetobacter sp. MD2(2019)]MEB3754983.1 hypothetical protein [Acinetobacter sp. MD2(2019)]
MKDINKIKSALQSIVKAKDDGYFNEHEWSIDYSIDLNADLFNQLSKLNHSVEFLSEAIERKDEFAIVAALISTVGFSMNLEGYFRNITEDIDKIFQTEGYLKDLPEDYKIPEFYNYDL